MPNDTREYKTLVTTIGKSKIAMAVQGEGKVNITQAAVGDGEGAYYIPTSDMTALRRELWRGSIAGKWINEQSANMIDVKMILPADVGGFTVREAALFDDDDDMIAVCNLPDTEKAVIATGAAGTLTIVLHIVLTDASAVEFKIDPNLDVVTAADVERLIARATVKRDITIPIEGWTACVEDDVGAGMQYLDIAQQDITEDMVPFVSILPRYLAAAADCGFCPAAKTLKGALRLFAKSHPAQEITATLVLLLASSGPAEGGTGGSEDGYTLPVATADRLGGVMIGDGVDVESNGRISVNKTGLLDDAIATDADVRETLENVFGTQE